MITSHLVNCSHSKHGWCLGCVKELWEQLWNQGATIELNKELNVSVDGDSVPVGEVVSVEPISVNRGVHEVMGNSSDTTRYFAPNDEIVTELKVTCVSRKASDG